MKRRGKRDTWYFDIESTNWTTFELAAAYRPRTGDLEYFTTLEELHEFVTTTRAVFWAHNAGGFDAKFLVPVSLEAGTFRGCRMVGGKFYEVFMGEGVVRDTLYLLKESLARLAPMFGLQKMDMDYSKISRDDKATWAYLANDCRVLAAVHQGVTEYLGFEHSPGTIGTAAVRSWLNGRPPPFNPGYELQGRQAYYGGRCEIYKLEGSAVRGYDINSLYPYIMRSLMPVGPWTMGKALTPKTAVAGVRVKVPYQHIPPIPLLRDRLYFPVGEFYTTLARAELEVAEPWVTRVQWTVESEEWAPIFRSWVDEHYAKRLEAQRAGNKAGAMIEKWLMNNLSGKLCEREEKDRILQTDELYEGDELVDVDYDLVRRTYNVKVPHAQPLVGAQITCGGRVEHWRWLTAAAERGAVYYGATDSIHCDTELPTGPGLGELKLETDAAPARYLQCGVYRHGGRAKIRGYKSLPKADGSHGAAEIFGRLEEKGKVELDTFGGAMTVLKAREFEFSPGREKRLVSEYKKRRVFEDGTTAPWEAQHIAWLGKKHGRRASGLTLLDEAGWQMRVDVLDYIKAEGYMKPYRKGLEKEENAPLMRRRLMRKDGVQALDVMTELINTAFGTSWDADEFRNWLLQK